MCQRVRQRRRGAGRGGLAAWAVAALSLAAFGGCEREPRASPNEAPSAPTEPAECAEWIEASRWSRAEAVARLADADAAVLAAIRLVQLAEVDAACVPSRVTPAAVGALRVVPLPGQRWALGLADRRDSRRVRLPVLIAADGAAQVPLGALVEELAVLVVSDDSERFPDLLILPDRVLILDAGAQLVPALVLASDSPVRFDAANQEGIARVVLVAPGEQGEVVVATYDWSVYELTFMGPAADDLPEPPGGSFELDLKASRRLEPQGGRMPPPRENRPPPGEVEELLPGLEGWQTLGPDRAPASTRSSGVM